MLVGNLCVHGCTVFTLCNKDRFIVVQRLHPSFGGNLQDIYSDGRDVIAVDGLIINNGLSMDMDRAYTMDAIHSDTKIRPRRGY